MVFSTNLGYFRVLKRFLFSGEKKSMTAMSISGYHLIPYIKSAYQISIYVKMTEKNDRSTDQMNFKVLFFPSAQNF